VIVLALGSTDANRRSLVTAGSSFSTTFANTLAFVPVEPYSANIVYGIDNVSPARPFNRAEYYIANNAEYPTPRHCAPNTGVLVKAVVAHDGTGTTPTLLPLVDCAADMQIIYGLDADLDPATALAWSPDISAGMTAADIRAQLAEIRVHILAQEGQRDDSYTTPSNTIFVGSQGVGKSFNVSGYRNYRWKLYSIVVKPVNLAQ
jgi:hypothetical protein